MRFRVEILVNNIVTQLTFAYKKYQVLDTTLNNGLTCAKPPASVVLNRKKCVLLKFFISRIDDIIMTQLYLSNQIKLN